tara:strand:+ start:190 stop:357 length:168 start_codon:yes stop_codon:yes gene_type:complete
MKKTHSEKALGALKQNKKLARGKVWSKGRAIDHQFSLNKKFKSGTNQQPPKKRNK